MEGDIAAKYVVESTRTRGRCTARTFAGRVVDSVRDGRGYRISVAWRCGDQGVIRLTRGKYNSIKFTDVSGRPEWVISRNFVRISLKAAAAAPPPPPPLLVDRSVRVQKV